MRLCVKAQYLKGSPYRMRQNKIHLKKQKVKANHETNGDTGAGHSLLVLKPHHKAIITTTWC